MSTADRRRSSRGTTTAGKEPSGFTDEERAAMKERARELKNAGNADGERAVLAKVAGMPAHAGDGKVVCFCQSAARFKSRYATLGFSDAANLDDGAMWPTSFALKELTPAVEARIAALVSKAAG
jgi:uncharacterized protein YdhG (YjbR/CyaY superfamily)